MHAAMNAFEQQGKIGEGAFGTVIQAKRLATGELVAIKKVRLRQDESGKVVREMMALQKLCHPNVSAKAAAAHLSNLRLASHRACWSRSSPCTRPFRTPAPLAVGETVILLAPPSPFSRRFNRGKQGGVSKMTELSRRRLGALMFVCDLMRTDLRKLMHSADAPFDPSQIKAVMMQVR